MIRLCLNCPFTFSPLKQWAVCKEQRNGCVGGCVGPVSRHWTSVWLIWLLCFLSQIWDWWNLTQHVWLLWRWVLVRDFESTDKIRRGVGSCTCWQPLWRLLPLGAGPAVLLNKHFSSETPINNHVCPKLPLYYTPLSLVQSCSVAKQNKKWTGANQSATDMFIFQ